MSRFASQPTSATALGAGKPDAARRADAQPSRGWRRRAMSLAFGSALALGFAAQSHAQSDGPIAIPGNAETNPAAVAAMVERVGKPHTAAVDTTPALQAVARSSGYRSAANAADAAMRAAAIALDARAEAADDSTANAGMIVIPGPGEARQAAAPKAAPALPMTQSAQSAQSAPSESGMIEIPGNGEPKAAAGSLNAINKSANAGDPLPRLTQTRASSRDVMPVVVSSDASDAAPARGGIRPIAAAPAQPVAAGMMQASMRTTLPGAALNAPRRIPAQPMPNAAANAAGSQDGDSIRAAALAFLQQQAAGLPGKVEITVMPAFPRGLAACDTLEPFMPTGARLWGRTTVGVRCAGEHPWTLYLQARVALNATYFLAARAIAPGEVLTAADLVARDGDLASMPQAVVTDPAQAVGATTLSRVPAGLPLRTDMLRSASSVAIGQTVHVVTNGTGFAISAEGSVMNNAAPGQQVRVKTAGGQIISGIVKDSQTVEIRL